MRSLCPSRSTVALAVASVALFAAVGGPAAAITAGNFILGKSNTADHQTTLTSSNAGSPTLALSNSSTTAGSVPLKLTSSPGLPPFQTNSTTLVPHLNASELNGLTSSSFQRTVTGNCYPSGAIQTVLADGTVGCIGATRLVSADSSQGPFPDTNVGAVTVPPDSSRLMVTFNGSGFRDTSAGPGLVSLELMLCTSDPCGPGNAAEHIYAETYANATATHIPVASATTWSGLSAGTYYIGIAEPTGTTTDYEDNASWTITSFTSFVG